ncbi:MAG TPA: hypothetical protein VGQ35_12635 [Dongiaceae bacterium]|jgi:hypothetical protein|nr:hypothetical protein [Dongiaceae bacterium]
MEAGAVKDRRSEARSGSPETQQVAAARPEIAGPDWDSAAQHIVTEIRVHAFGNALGLLVGADGTEVLLVLPDQVAILLQESLTLVATYLIGRAHPPRSRSEH